jgi:DNA-binding MarR family transcriptional regulator
MMHSGDCMAVKSGLPEMSRMGVVFLAWRRHLESGLRTYNITLKQQYLLKRLAEREHLHPSEIAEMLFCDRPTATVVISNMKRYGWIRSKRDETNGRMQIVTLSEAGREKLKELERMPKEAIDPLGCFTAKERTEFDRLLRKLQKHLKACGL